MPQALEGRVENFVSEEMGKISVNWQAIADFKGRCGYEQRGVFDETFNNILEHLKTKGVLSFSLENSFILLGSGMNLNPRFSRAPGDPLNFTREEDARDYARAFYGNAFYSVSLVKGVSAGVNRTK